MEEDFAAGQHGHLKPVVLSPTAPRLLASRCRRNRGSAGASHPEALSLSLPGPGDPCQSWGAGFQPQAGVSSRVTSQR